MRKTNEISLYVDPDRLLPATDPLCMHESFKKRIVKASRKAHTAKAFGIMFTEENNRIEQVEIGRRYVRVHLMATKLGLSMHPMSQILQEYEELV